MKTLRVKNLVCGLSVLTSALCLPSQSYAAHHNTGHATRRAQMRPVELEVWPGQRVILILPLELGANWNADPALGRALLLDGQARLQSALLKTGKLSVMQLQKYNPIFTRAVQDRKMTQKELDDLTDVTSTTPWLDRARQALARLTFEQPPLIGDFSIEELRSNGDQARPSVQIQVSGRMYDLGNAAPIKTVVVTSSPFQSVRDPLAAIHSALSDAFQQLGSQLVSPLTISNLPTGDGTTRITPMAPLPVVPAPVQPTVPVPPTLPNSGAQPADTGQPTQPVLPPVQPGQPAPTESPAPANPAPTAPALKTQ